MENREKQKEIHELAKQMGEAISTEIEQRYIEDEAKLQAVLIENGWRRASEVAREIFAEIEKCFFEELVGCTEAKLIDEQRFAELKKQYTEDT